MQSAKWYMIVGLLAATISFMQTNTMHCLCNCKITRVTVIRSPQVHPQPQEVIAPVQEQMEESQQAPSTVEQTPVIIIASPDEPDSVSHVQQA